VMEKTIGTARVEVSPADATLEVDGERQVAGPGGYTLPLDPGLHALLARRTGYRDRSESFVMESGGQVDLRVQLEVAAVGPVATPAADAEPHQSPAELRPPSQPVQTDEPPRKRWRRALWVTGGVLVAGAAATVLALTLRSPKEKDPCRTTTCAVID
jgi:hypothetical protein